MKNFEENIINKLNNCESLSEDERSDLIFGGYEIHREHGDMRRWHTEVRSIIELSDKFYAIDWLIGNTENQDNEYYEDPFEVRRVTKTIIVEEYVPIDSIEDGADI